MFHVAFLSFDFAWGSMGNKGTRLGTGSCLTDFLDFEESSQSSLIWSRESVF